MKIPPNVRAWVIARDGMVCRRCGRQVGMFDYSIHHRRPRGMGGSKLGNKLSNLVTLCGSGTTGCHGWVESHRNEALEQGWLVRRISLDFPEEIPMVDLFGRMFALDDLGGVTYITTGSFTSSLMGESL